MNGLEAIELMKQGKMVIEVGTNEPFILRIENGVVWFKNSKALNREWVIDDCFDFTIDYEEYIEKQLTGWERVAKGEKYVSITQHPKVKYTEFEDETDDNIYGIANYFSTEEKAEEINFKQTLFRKLQRFSDENGGSEIDWNDAEQYKYFICYNYNNSKFVIECWCRHRQFGQVNFISEEVAEKAIELFHDDLIKYFTHDWSGGNE